MGQEGTDSITCSKSLDRCAECGQGFGADGCTTANGRRYHKACFLCHECGEPIAGNFKVDEKGKRSCKACMKKELCAGCRRPLGADNAMVLGDKKYHRECVKCDACGVQLNGGVFRWTGHVLCEGCGERPRMKLAEKYAKEDYYKLLDVEGTASKAEIAKAFKKAALQLQIGNGPANEWLAEHKLKQVTEAYKTLIDDDKRDTYDKAKKDSKVKANLKPISIGDRWRSNSSATTSAGTSFTSDLGTTSFIGSPRLLRPGSSATTSPGTSFTTSPGTSFTSDGGSPRPASDADGPICHTCNKIIDGDVIKAMGKTFHEDCFRCKFCQAALGKQFFASDDDAICPKCSEESCVAKNCGMCGKRILGQYKKMEGGKVVCSDCSPAVACGACGKELCGPITLFDGMKFHKACFACQGCGDFLVNKNVFAGQNKEIFCEGCAKKENDKTLAETIGMCMKCGEVLSGEYVIVEGHKFHAKCFTCDQCGGRIEGSYIVEEQSGRFSKKVRNKPRKRFVCEKCT